MNSSDELIIQELSLYLEQYNGINMYTTVFIIAFGFVGNLLALTVLIYSRNKLPRIIGNNYLILLTVVNTLFLFLQFYVVTYNRMIYHFNMNYKNSYQFLDSSIICCKLLPYFRYAFRLTNTMLTVCFSVERLLAVYCPLQMRTLDTKCAYFFKLSILFSFIVPTYLLFLTELVPNSELDNTIYRKLGIKKSFNFNSLTPLFGDFTCSMSKKNFSLMLKFHILLFLLIFVCYIIIAISIFAIVLRLKNSNNFVFAFRSKATSNSAVAAAASNNENNNPKCSKCSGSGESAKELLEIKTQEMLHIENGINRAPSNSSFSSIELPKKRIKLQLINHRIQNTKMLISISASYVLLNLPYFLVMLASMIFGIREENIVTVMDVAFRLKVWSYVLITEIFQLVNFSVVGLLFFCSGKIFRHHALKFCKKINSLFKRP